MEELDLIYLTNTDPDLQVSLDRAREFIIHVYRGDDESAREALWRDTGYPDKRVMQAGLLIDLAEFVRVEHDLPGDGADPADLAQMFDDLPGGRQFREDAMRSDGVELSYAEMESIDASVASASRLAVALMGAYVAESGVADTIGEVMGARLTYMAVAVLLAKAAASAASRRQAEE